MSLLPIYQASSGGEGGADPVQRFEPHLCVLLAKDDARGTPFEGRANGVPHTFGRMADEIRPAGVVVVDACGIAGRQRGKAGRAGRADRNAGIEPGIDNSASLAADQRALRFAAYIVG